MKIKAKKNMIPFKAAVDATADIKNCFRVGLQALGNYSKKIELGNNSKCEGSVDLDACTTQKYPQSNRWDYMFCYKGEVYFVEVHSANTSEVGVVLKKLQWLKDWLHHNAPDINRLKAKDKPFVWIQSNGFKILPGSSQFREIIQKGLKPVPKLALT